MTNTSPLHPFFSEQEGYSIVYFQLYWSHLHENTGMHTINGVWFNNLLLNNTLGHSEIIFIKAERITKTMRQFTDQWNDISKLAGITTHGWFYQPQTPITRIYSIPNSMDVIPWHIVGHSIRSYKPSFELEDMGEQKLYAHVDKILHDQSDEIKHNFIDYVFNYGIEMGMHNPGANNRHVYSPSGLPFATVRYNHSNERLVITSELQRDV